MKINTCILQFSGNLCQFWFILCVFFGTFWKSSEDFRYLWEVFRSVCFIERVCVIFGSGWKHWNYLHLLTCTSTFHDKIKIKIISNFRYCCYNLIKCYTWICNALIFFFFFKCTIRKLKLYLTLQLLICCSDIIHVNIKSHKLLLQCTSYMYIPCFKRFECNGFFDGLSRYCAN